MSNLIDQPIWSSFWLDKDDDGGYSSFFTSKDKDDENDESFDGDTMKLSSVRRAIANFVNILTDVNVPVHFWSGDTGATDGKTVYLSSDITKKEDFDPAVGLALHEGSHVVETDFELIKTVWGRISELYKIGKSVGIDKETVRKFTHLMVNYVEDRFIDDKAFRTAPGYRPYYVALYDKYFNNDIISEQLQSKLMRQPTLQSYEVRIINLTNPKTDLDALPGLRKIAEELNLKNISRLKTTKDRIKVAIDIAKIVFSSISSNIDEQKQNKQKKPSKQKSEIFFDIRMDGEGEPNDGNEPNDESKEPQKGDGGNGSGEDEDDILGGEKVEALGSNDTSNDVIEDDGLGDKSDLSKRKLQKIKKAIEFQKNFLDDHSSIQKTSITDKQKRILDIIEKSGISVVSVGMDLTPANTPAFGIECVVVKNMTKQLMTSKMFPMCTKTSTMSGDQLVCNENVRKAVIKGIQIGTQLGKKLQIRQETNTTKFTRRGSGKIDKRILSDIACGVESIFYKMHYDKYDKLNLHISVDSSSSMSENEKWEKTMTTVVAICKAASMISNLRVAVSFRSTIERVYYNNNNYLPYVILAYDSDKDKFSKIKNLFPYLNTYGSTPEGLAFEATMDKLISKRVGEDYYFLTISDGEPCFSYYGPNNVRIDYNMVSGAEHTRKQYQKIIQSGVKGMAYFVESRRYAYSSSYGTVSNDSDSHVKCFKRMYGKDARFIDVNNITSIAKTMNGLFLTKE